MEYVTRRDILFVGNFILQFIIYLKVKYPQHLKVDTTRTKTTSTEKLPERQSMGFALTI